VNDDLRALTQDLIRYLGQQQEAGLGWYFDAGEPPPPAPLLQAAQASSSQATQASSPQASHAPAPQAAPAPRPSDPHPVPAAPAPAAADAVQPVGASMTKEQREAVFADDCEAFVRRTLAAIDRQPAAAAPAARDMFADPAAAPPRTREEKAAALESLASRVAGCTACKLHPTRTQTVFGVGDPDAKLVFVGEAPGRNEDEQGEPFVGRAGKLLNDILKAIGFAREDVYICNILKCRPPENRDPEPDEVRACEPFLVRQLEILQPKVICCLGRHAAMTLLQTRASLGSMRQDVSFYRGIPVLATYHPAALLRNPHWKRDTWDDVRRLRALHDALLARD